MESRTYLGNVSRLSLIHIYNGSERFSKAHRFGFFPSVGLGWILSNEAFWSDGMKKAIPLFKLKATHGLVGNDAIGGADDRFFYLSQVNLSDWGRRYYFGSEFNNPIPGISISRYENPNICLLYTSPFSVFSIFSLL